MRYHGNYVGPGWSAGKYQDSVEYSTVPPIDEFDRTAMVHDRAYARGRNLKDADYAFYKANIGKGFKRSVAALAVGGQGVLRQVGVLPDSSEKNNQMAESRGRKPYRTPSRSRSRSPMKVDSIRKRRYSMIRSKSTPALQKMRAGRVARFSKRMAGATSSKSKGFVGYGSRRLPVIDKYAKYGVVLHRENGAVVSTDGIEKAQAFLIGHATCSKLQLINDVCHALTKLIATRMGMTIVKFSDSILGNWVAPVEVVIRVYYTIWSLAAESNFIVVCDGTNNSWEYISQQLFANIQILINGESGFQLERILVERKDFNGASPGNYGVCQIDLQEAKVDLYTKSTMKVQNRTINASGNVEADDVDNVPLYGKTYMGSGNYFKTQNALFACDVFGTAVSNGNILVVKCHPTNYPALREPLSKGLISHCSKVGKIHLDPAEIKTSSLVYKLRIKLNTMFQQLIQVGGEITNIAACKYGKYHFVHLEKMIQAVGVTDVNAMNLAYEVDSKVGVIISAPKVRHSSYVEYLNNQ